jgi:hypothetical protein
MEQQVSIVVTSQWAEVAACAESQQDIVAGAMLTWIIMVY